MSAMRLGFVDPYKSKCLPCGLNEQVAHGKFEVAGEGRKGILILVESPTKDETATGKDFQGEFYFFLDRKLKSMGISLKKDCWRVHVMRCKKKGKKGNEYSRSEIDYCSPYLLGQIEKLKPKVILSFGATALNVLLTKEFSDTSIGRWHGIPIPYTTEKKHRCWLLPTFVPIFKEENKNDIYMPIIEKEIGMISKLHQRELPPVLIPYVRHLLDKDEILNMLERAKTAKYVSVDYETTGLKPENELMKLVTISLTLGFKEPSDDVYDDDGVETYSFPLMFKDIFNDSDLHKIANKCVEVIDNPNKLLIAHNAKFEQRWTQAFFGTTFQKGKTYCTQIMSHLIDERPKYSGLKFQTYINFGIPDYSKSILQYLVSDGGGNSLNKIEDAPLPELLEYNGKDTYYTYMLWKVQENYRRKNSHLGKGVFELEQEGVLALGTAEAEGFNLIEGYFEANTEKIRKEISDLEAELLSSDEAKTFRKNTGRTFKFGNNRDLEEMLYEIIGVKLDKKTASGARAKDAEVLISMKHSWTDKLLELNKLKKVEGTYFGQINREAIYDKIHTFYYLHTTRTSRSSSGSPNWQNIPKRDPIAKNYIRKGVCAPEGQHLFEADYGSLEVRVAACYTKDPKLISYILDPSTDMHRDSALEIFDMSKNTYDSIDKKLAKVVRFHAKNGFVFANFYGSSYRSCAKTLWKVAPDIIIEKSELASKKDMNLADHLRYRGFRKYEEYEEHIKEVVDVFWKKFSTFRKWQKDTEAFYNKHKYVENYLGFRRRGPLGHNEIINTAIQGTAFMCLLWAFNRLDDIQTAEGWQSRLRGQIHDSIIGSLEPSEYAYVLSTIKNVMEIELREAYKWINVPMVAEFEISPINGTWADLEGVEI
jgi:uracil-DNA glycosylase family 4